MKRLIFDADSNVVPNMSVAALKNMPGTDDTVLGRGTSGLFFEPSVFFLRSQETFLLHGKMKIGIRERLVNECVMPPFLVVRFESGLFHGVFQDQAVIGLFFRNKVGSVV